MFKEALTSPENVADKIGEKGMDLSKVAGVHILEKLDGMTPHEEGNRAERRSARFS